MVDIIEKKRLGAVLTKEEIAFFVNGYTNGKIPDYQVSALLMAIYFQGMNLQEITDLTLEMANSGDIIDLSKINGIKVDKHSTGGVGDTTTLILAPLVASCGVPVAKMSGRGLGHTGGTLDKFEAIPGFSIDLNEEEFIQSVNDLKVAVIGQTAQLAPADKLLYALRDVTSTVQSLPLIASSIMSKKIAAGSDAICLDVTVGDGAFMKTPEEAEELANIMVKIGKLAGRETVAVISDMSEPLGYAIGNSLEVLEAIDVLKGKGPSDLKELTFVLGAQMLLLAKKVTTLEEGKQLLQEKIDNGEAFEKFKEMVKNQGGDLSYIEEPEKLNQAKYVYDLPAKESGFITKIVADKVGIAAMKLGAGRQTKEDEIDFSVGLVLQKKVGDSVKEGESIVKIYSNTEDIEEIKQDLYNNISIGAHFTTHKLIHAII